MQEALGLFARLLTMDKIELMMAKMKTDNPKFKNIIQDTIDARFPEKK